MIFSLNLNTPFLFELNKEKENTNSRLSEINKMFSLDRFQISSSKEIEVSSQTYRWDRINSGLEELRNTSKKTLFELLKTIP